MLVFSLQFSMVSIAFPELERDLDAPLRWTGWVLTIFMVGQVISLPVSGRLADRYGRRTVFASGLVLFAVASAACALAPNIYALIGARALQGLAGGALMPSAMGLVGEAFMENRMRPIGFLGSIVPAGGIVGPVLGGLIVEYFGWRWTFGINVPLVAVALAGIFAFTPRGTTTPGEGRLDFAGIGMLAVAATAFIFALTELGQTEQSPNAMLVAISFGIALVSAVLLVRHELRTPHPFLDLELFRRREFISANTLAFLFGSGLFGVFLLIPYYASTVYGFSASETGAIVTPRSVTLVLASGVTAAILPYIGVRLPMFLGMLGFAGAMVLLSLSFEDPTVLGIEISSFAWVTGVVATAGLAFGLVNPALNNANLHLVPDRIAGVTGLRQMFMSLGGTIGISVIVLISSRASSEAQGLEWSFAGLAFVVVLASVGLLGIREAPRHGSGGATSGG